MTLADRLRMIASALPSDASAVTLTRADLMALLDDAPEASVTETSDLTVEQVAGDLKRAPSTVRGWLISGALKGYKLNRRDWRVPRASLRAYLTEQRDPTTPVDDEHVDLGAWRKVPRRAS